MESARRLGRSLGVVAFLGALLLLVTSRGLGAGPLPSFDGRLPALGPIPQDSGKLMEWLAQWPAWQRERRRLDREIMELRERLRDQGEAEASGGQPRWWDLPSRKRRDGRLRHLHRLRRDLERASARLFQAQALEAQWALDLQRRRSKGVLPESLQAVAQDLKDYAEKDLKYKD